MAAICLSVSVGPPIITSQSHLVKSLCANLHWIRTHPHCNYYHIFVFDRGKGGGFLAFYVPICAERTGCLLLPYSKQYAYSLCSPPALNVTFSSLHGSSKQPRPDNKAPHPPNHPHFIHGFLRSLLLALADCLLAGLVSHSPCYTRIGRDAHAVQGSFVRMRTKPPVLAPERSGMMMMMRLWMGFPLGWMVSRPNRRALPIL